MGNTCYFSYSRFSCPLYFLHAFQGAHKSDLYANQYCSKSSLVLAVESGVLGVRKHRQVAKLDTI